MRKLPKFPPSLTKAITTYNYNVELINKFTGIPIDRIVKTISKMRLEQFKKTGIKNFDHLEKYKQPKPVK